MYVRLDAYAEEWIFEADLESAFRPEFTTIRKLPPLNALRAFEASARHASITRAANELGVSHSAVSQQIRILEDYFGQAMFLRNGRNIEPTAEGKLLLEDIGAAFDRIEVAVDQFSGKAKTTAITINATPSFAMRWLIPRAAPFQLANPMVDVAIDTSAVDGIDHLTKRYDFIFRRAPMERPDHVCRKLAEDQATPVVSPRLARQFNRSEDLASSILLHVKSRPGAWPDWFVLAGDGSVDATSGQQYGHFFLSLQAAINGLGAAIGPLCFMEDDIRDGRLVAPFKDLVLTGPGFHVLYPRGLMRSRQHKAFLDLLLLSSDK